MFTVKSTSHEGVYFLVNHWQKNKTFWIEPEKAKPEMMFLSPRTARSSLTKLLKIMPDYKTDKFELVEVFS